MSYRTKKWSPSMLYWILLESQIRFISFAIYSISAWSLTFLSLNSWSWVIIELYKSIIYFSLDLLLYSILGCHFSAMQRSFNFLTPENNAILWCRCLKSCFLKFCFITASYLGMTLNKYYLFDKLPPLFPKLPLDFGNRDFLFWVTANQLTFNTHIIL